MEHFHLLEPKSFVSDRYYRVYYNEKGFFFFRIGGQFYSQRAFDKQTENQFILSIILLPFFKVSQKKQSAATKRYEDMIQQGTLEKALSKRKGEFFHLGTNH